jgi:DNA polymerase III epsilon subunit-like protein
VIVQHWPDWFRRLYSPDGAWPTSYCAIDVETSGYQTDRDVVTEWGHCLVENGEVVDRLGLVINWVGREVPPDFWLKQRLSQVRQGMALQGKTYHITYESMQQTGMVPEKAFAFIRQFADTVREKKIPFVAHNGFFDEKMLSANFAQFKFGKGFSLGDLFMDTACVEKASQITDNPRMHPKSGDTLRSYFSRVNYTRVNGVKSNLDGHCFAKYGLDRHVKPDDLHGAETDSFCCHLLMQEFGRRIGDYGATAPVYPIAAEKVSKHKATVPTAVVGVVRPRIRKQRNS